MQGQETVAAGFGTDTQKATEQQTVRKKSKTVYHGMKASPLFQAFYLCSHAGSVLRTLWIHVCL